MDKYARVKEFIGEYLGNGRIRYNDNRGYISHVTPIKERLESYGWKVSKIERPEWPAPRHHLVSPNGVIDLWLHGSSVSRHPKETSIICQRKELTRKMLSLHSLPVSPGADFSRNEGKIAEMFFDNLEKPAVVKPSNAGASRGVTTGVVTAEEFEKAWLSAVEVAGSSGRIIVEQQAEGIELRVLVVGDKVSGVVARIQPFVVGDGISSVEMLKAKLIEERSAFYRARQFDVKIDLDFLSKHGYGLDTVPAENEIVLLNPLALAGVGGSLVDVTDEVSDEIKAACVSACRAIPQLEIGGVDILVPNLVELGQATILEVNTAAAHNVHRYPTHGSSREVGVDIAEYYQNCYLQESNGVSSGVDDAHIPESVIQFRNLEVKRTKISLSAEFEGRTEEIWFEFDREINPSTEAIAVALSTLCGTKFDVICFDFEISENIAEEIGKFCKAKIECQFKEVYTREGNGSVLLSFSGGFDSLAALRLLPRDTNLVSMDFGGWFEREADFFKSFDTTVVSTNIRRVPSQRNSLARNHWSFMAIGAILTAEHFEADYHVFGSILGDKFSRPAVKSTVPPLGMIGLDSLPATEGVTELGTAKILLQTDPSRIADSITSLAGATDRKHYLKTALVHSVNEVLGGDATLPPMPKDWADKIAFDSSYTTAMSALYMLSHDQRGLVEPLFKSIPEEAYELSGKLSFDFMTKVNWDFYQFAPRDFKRSVMQKLIEFGFEPYTEADWEEARQVRHYLNRVFGR